MILWNSKLTKLWKWRWCRHHKEINHASRCSRRCDFSDKSSSDLSDNFSVYELQQLLIDKYHLWMIPRKESFSRDAMVFLIDPYFCLQQTFFKFWWQNTVLFEERIAIPNCRKIGRKSVKTITQTWKLCVKIFFSTM